MIPRDAKGDWDLSAATLQQVCDELAGIVLSEFVTKGGTGLRTAIWTVATVAMDWEKEQQKKKK